MRGKIYWDRDTITQFAVASSMFAIAIVLVIVTLLAGCAGWRDGAVRGLTYAERVASVATEGARAVCIPALDRCAKEQIANPCPYLESCIENTEKGRRAIDSFVHAIKAGWIAVRGSDSGEAIATVQKILIVAGEVRAILAQWGIATPKEIEAKP